MNRRALNRILWRRFIWATGPLVVWLERVAPGRGHGARVAAAAARAMVRALGVRLEVRGRERLDRRTAYVFTPNHRSSFDIAALMAALPGIRFAAKAELFEDPTLGPPMRALGMIPIDRARPDLAKRALEKASRSLGRRASVVIFPEGTFGPPGVLLPFKSGPFVFAIQTGMPVVPVALHNTGGVMPAEEDLSRLEVRPGRVVVELLDPIPTEGLTLDDRASLKERTRAALVAALRPGEGGTADRADLGRF